MSRVLKEKAPKDEVMAAVTDYIQSKVSPFDLASRSVPESFWLELGSPSDLRIEELLRSGRQALSTLYFDMHTSVQIRWERTMCTISQCVFNHRTYQLLLQHTKSPVGSSSSPTIRMHFVHLLAAALQQSLEPPEFAAWFEKVFGPLILCAERAIKEQLREQDTDAEDGGQPRAKRPRTEEAKYSKSFDFFLRLRSARPFEATEPWPCPSSSVYGSQGTSPRLVLQVVKPPNSSQLVGVTVTEAGRVREAVASIQRKNSPPSVPFFAPTLNLPPRLMPGAWPPSPPRLLPPGPSPLPKRPQRRMPGSWPSSPPRLLPPLSRLSVARTPLADKTNYSRFRRTSLTSANYRTPHFCPLLKE
ncbi:hypothetical protein MSAN_00345600 [Mycena sanguinolenta]|uniref:Uncharacterized protein n=1 Tax=Mycena sanguinolenta TaxID=230812 RepID=A0A8H6Z8R1_9AGAR|nr:hypothetical protein MSAN_00345600 [Mycena sanguinolenta]